MIGLFPYPAECQMCGGEQHSVIIDGRISWSGMWALMCESCHEIHGSRLGVGRGQKYRYQTSPLEQWVKEHA